MTHRFHVCGVFATERYAGNQLAVVEAAEAEGVRMRRRRRLMCDPLIGTVYRYSPTPCRRNTEMTYNSPYDATATPDDRVTVGGGGRVVPVAEGTLY